MPGFITLSASDSAAQGLDEATLSLLSGEGSIQNAGYALRWWAFAAFAAMTWRFVRTIDAREPSVRCQTRRKNEPARDGDPRDQP